MLGEIKPVNVLDTDNDIALIEVMIKLEEIIEKLNEVGRILIELEKENDDLKVFLQYP